MSSTDEGSSEQGLVRQELQLASDATLVVAVGRWNQDALAEIYRRHAGAVVGLARRVLGDTTRAEDIAQEIFVRLWNDPQRFDSERGSLRSFLLAQAHGRAIDLLRSDSSRRQREEREARRRASGGYDLEREVWDMAMAEHVKDALGALPVEERDAIELAYFGGHSYREVARLLDEPEGTVKSRIRSGLRRLQTELASAGISGTGGAQ